MKKLFVLAMSAMMIFAATNSVFAAEGPQSTPVKLTAATTGIDITVSEGVHITAEANNVVAETTDYTIKNNNSVSCIKVSSVVLTPVDGWKKIAYNEEAFKALGMDSRKFALSGQVGSGEAYDLYSDWTNVGIIGYGETMTIKLAGLVGPTTVAETDTQIANLVATVYFAMG